jgi:SNF family Na+-dependent transporter
MWTIIYLCLWKGIRLTSRVAVFTALFPYLPMLALFIRGMTLDGAWYGLKYYLIPDAQRILNKKAWIQAAGHVLWAYGIGWGIIPALSSYNRPDYNFYRDIVVTGSTSILTNVFSGFVVFPVLGFMSHKANVSIEQVVSSGPGLAFIVYPKAVSLMPFPHFWAITFFFMIFLLGIDSQFVTCESVLTATLDKLDQWYERNPKRRKIRREYVVAIYVLISFSFGLLMTTRAGFYIFNIFDGYICGAIPLLIICIAQLATVLFAYRTTFSSWYEKWPPSQWPGQAFITHISEVLKRRLTHIWLCWIIVVPIWLFGMLAIAIHTVGPITYEKFVYPLSFQIIGYVLTSIAPSSILIYFIYYQFKENR